MATIRKRKGGYQVQVRRKGSPAISSTFQTRGEAIAWAARTEGEVLTGQTPTTLRRSQRVLFASCLDDYVTLRCDSVGPAQSSKPKQIRSLARRVRSDLGAYYMDNLTPKILCEWRDSLLAEGKANQTVVHHLNLVSSVYERARKHFHTYTGPNPAKLIERPSVAQTGRTRVVTPEEVNLITSSLSVPLTAFIRIAYETGMRRGEVERIERTHLDTVAKTLLIPITKTGKPRTIPVSANCIGWIEDLLQGQDKPAIRGEWVADCFRREARRHGIEGVVFHSLRHSVVTRLFEAGLTHFEVMAMSGHASLTHLKRYTHIGPSHLAAKLGYV